MAIPPVVVSIQVGRPRTLGRDDAVEPMDQCWTTSFFKEPVGGTVRVGATNLAGDEQADLENHGGPDKAVCVYSAAHYPHWEQELGISPLPYGAFGENLSIATLTERDLCIGDVWEIGTARFQVSQPRQPCWKMARRWRMADLPARVITQGRTGWYFRVLREGEISAAMPLQLIERPFPDWPVSRANEVFYFQKNDVAANAELAAITLLSESWRAVLRRHAQEHQE